MPEFPNAIVGEPDANPTDEPQMSIDESRRHVATQASLQLLSGRGVGIDELLAAAKAVEAYLKG